MGWKLESQVSKSRPLQKRSEWEGMGGGLLERKVEDCRKSQGVGEGDRLPEKYCRLGWERPGGLDGGTVGPSRGEYGQRPSKKSTAAVFPWEGGKGRRRSGEGRSQ